MSIKVFFCALLLPVGLLCGCTGEQEDNDLALQLRADFLDRTGCAGTMTVTADYGQRVYEYTVTFSGSETDGLSLVITAPEEAAGITATIAQGQTFLTFDGVQLETGPLNEDGLSPLDVRLHRRDGDRAGGRDRNPPPVLPGTGADAGGGSGDFTLV